MGYLTRESKLSGLVIDADLTMGAHNITLGAAQTVDGKDVSILRAPYNIVQVNGSEETQTGTVWKEIGRVKVNVDLLGTHLRLYGEMHTSIAGGIAHFGIYDAAALITEITLADNVPYEWVTGSFVAHGDTGDKEYTLKIKDHAGGTTVSIKKAFVEFKNG